jgi:hypothetical protein
MEPEHQVIAILLGFGVIAVLVAVKEISSQREQVFAQHQAAAQFHERAARAVWAGATILSIRNCNPKGEPGGKSMIDIKLQVLKSDQKTYNATAIWIVDSIALPALKPGQHIPVKIDQEDRITAGMKRCSANASGSACCCRSRFCCTAPCCKCGLASVCQNFRAASGSRRPFHRDLLLRWGALFANGSA